MRFCLSHKISDFHVIFTLLFSLSYWLSVKVWINLHKPYLTLSHHEKSLGRICQLIFVLFQPQLRSRLMDIFIRSILWVSTIGFTQVFKASHKTLTFQSKWHLLPHKAPYSHRHFFCHSCLFLWFLNETKITLGNHNVQIWEIVFNQFFKSSLYFLCHFENPLS